MFQPVEFVEQLFYGSVHLAARAGDMSRMRKLLEVDPHLVRARLRGMTPLHYAADNRQTEMLELLLAKKSDPNAPDQIGRTALHYCAQRGWLEGAKILLNNGANPDAMTKSAFRVSRRYLASRTAIDELVQGTAMDIAIAVKNVEMVRLLREFEGHRRDEIVGAH